MKVAILFLNLRSALSQSSEDNCLASALYISRCHWIIQIIHKEYIFHEKGALLVEHFKQHSAGCSLLIPETPAPLPRFRLTLSESQHNRVYVWEPQSRCSLLKNVMNSCQSMLQGHSFKMQGKTLKESIRGAGNRCSVSS